MIGAALNDSEDGLLGIEIPLMSRERTASPAVGAMSLAAASVETVACLDTIAVISRTRAA